jgi:hypothetical protein
MIGPKRSGQTSPADDQEIARRASNEILRAPEDDGLPRMTQERRSGRRQADDRRRPTVGVVRRAHDGRIGSVPLLPRAEADRRDRQRTPHVVSIGEQTPAPRGDPERLEEIAGHELAEPRLAPLRASLRGARRRSRYPSLPRTRRAAPILRCWRGTVGTPPTRTASSRSPPRHCFACIRSNSST